jgi:hypothetical protein
MADQVERFKLIRGTVCALVRTPNGPWVRNSDFEKLEVERDRLRLAVGEDLQERIKLQRKLNEAEKSRESWIDEAEHQEVERDKAVKQRDQELRKRLERALVGKYDRGHGKEVLDSIFEEADDDL